MESSNTPDTVADTGIEAASPSENSVDTEVSNPTTPEAPRVEPSLSEKIKTLSKAPADPTAPATQPDQPVYQPNWKYKAFGKEKEIDEFWRPLVKDPEAEKKVKDVFTRAEAFDDMKTKHEGTQTQFQELLGDYQALDKDVRKVMQFRKNGDFENFFQSLRISDDEIFDYAKKKIELLNMPAEQRQAFDAQTRERQRLFELEEQNQNLEQTYQTQAVQARTMQLDMVLSRPEIQSAASAWDQKVGQDGAFRNLIIDEGHAHWFRTGAENGGEDLPPDAVANMVMQKFGKFLGEPQAQSPQVATPAPQAPPPGTTQVVTKPVIPTANGRGTSPIARVPKSLDDLKAMAKEASAAGL